MDKGLDIARLRSLLAAHAALDGAALPARAFDTADAARRSPQATATAVCAAARSCGREPLWAQADAALEWCAADTTHHIVVCGDPAYPPRLAEIPAPPPVLFVSGARAALHAEQLAVVGARKASRAACAFARTLAADLAVLGVAITSGLARGIDAAAHYGALDGGGVTIAVFGCGLDRVYPAPHRSLAQAIAEAGALVSEFPFGAAPRRHHFPQRNRIIAGLSLGTLVVEAALRSGSLSTAMHALEQGREVFAVPGSIHNPLSQGCHALLRQGAKLTAGLADIVEEFPHWAGHRRAPVAAPASAAAAERVGGGAERLLDVCGWSPFNVDEAVALSGLTVQDVSAILIRLELAGLVELRASGSYVRTR